jgi:uncharacterized membrane protein YfcA
MRSTFARLAVIATVAGAFSGLFGVGGGTIIVPLLILWLAYEEREATGTSLAAIVVIAAFAAGAHALYGNVDPAGAAVVAGPALVGVVAGTALQQRVRPWVLSGVFAVLLVLSAALLVAP